MACALAATDRGKRAVVIDRDERANGAAVRNFGFVTVTGQERGPTWRRARRSRDIWAAVAPAAGVAGNAALTAVPGTLAQGFQFDGLSRPTFCRDSVGTVGGMSAC